jgi:hypothetical protein
MAEVLFVHGMNEPRNTKEKVLKSWRPALNRCLEAAGHPRLSPSQIDLVYWADLFVPEEVKPHPPTKGIAEAAERAYFALVRKAVQAIDKGVEFDDEGKPKTVLARLVRKLIYQTAYYMHNATAPAPRNKKVGAGVYHQVQSLFREALTKDTRVVIGHSLGSVIAYEALVKQQSSVDTLITIGSPIATRELIYEHLRTEVQPPPQPWPGTVRRWINLVRSKDAWIVPQPKLAGRFAGKIEERTSDGGSVWEPIKTHRLTEYLTDPPVAAAVAQAIREASQSR